MTWRQIVDRSEGHIAKLAPGFQERVAKWYQELTAKRIPVLIYCSVRTPAEQDELFKKRPKVTNAKGTPVPQSFHCYGRAIDAVPAIRNSAGEYLAAWEDTTTYEIMRKIGEKHGLRWLSWELPHFEDAAFKDWRALAAVENDSPGTRMADKNRQVMQAVKPGRKVAVRKP